MIGTFGVAVRTRAWHLGVNGAPRPARPGRRPRRSPAWWPWPPPVRPPWCSSASPTARCGGGALSRLAALISAIGASFFLQELFALRYGRDADPRLPPGHEQGSTLFTIVRRPTSAIDKVLVIVAAVVMMVVLDRFVNRTRLGRGIRAVAQDPETAALMGVNIDRVVTATFLIGGLMAGVAGLLYMSASRTPSYNVGFLLGIKAFTAAVLGGIGNLRGALLGGLLLGLIENYGGALFGAQWKDVIAFVVLVVVLMFRPTGSSARVLGEGAGMTGDGRRSTASATAAAASMPDVVGAGRRAWLAPRSPTGRRLGVAPAALGVRGARCPAISIAVRIMAPAESDWATSVLFFPSASTCSLAIGLNVVVGQAGLLDLGLRRLLRHRRLHDGAARHQAALELLGGPARSASLLPPSPGVILGAPTLRLRGDYLAIVTLGFGEIIRITANNLELDRRARGASPTFPTRRASTTVDQVHLTLRRARPEALLLAAAHRHRRRDHRGRQRLEHSRVGRAWAAIREDEDAAELMGVPTFKFKLWAFAIGAGIGGAGRRALRGQGRSRSRPTTSSSCCRSCSWPRWSWVARATCRASSSAPSWSAYLPGAFPRLRRTTALPDRSAPRWWSLMIFRPQGLCPAAGARPRCTTGRQAGTPGPRFTGPTRRRGGLGAE